MRWIIYLQNYIYDNNKNNYTKWWISRIQWIIVFLFIVVAKTQRKTQNKQTDRCVQLSTNNLDRFANLAKETTSHLLPTSYASARHQDFKFVRDSPTDQSQVVEAELPTNIFLGVEAWLGVRKRNSLHRWGAGHLESSGFHHSNIYRLWSLPKGAIQKVQDL